MGTDFVSPGTRNVSCPRLLQSALVVGSAIISAACNPEGVGGLLPNPEHVRSVVVSPSTPTINVGGHVGLVAAVSADSGVGTAVVWSSRDTTNAIVDASSNVTGVAATAAAVVCAISVADTTKGGLRRDCRCPVSGDDVDAAEADDCWDVSDAADRMRFATCDRRRNGREPDRRRSDVSGSFPLQLGRRRLLRAVRQRVADAILFSLVCGAYSMAERRRARSHHRGRADVCNAGRCRTCS